MFKWFSLSLAARRPANRQGRKLAAKSSLGVETLDPRQLLTTFSFRPLSSMSYLSVPRFTPTYSASSIWSTPSNSTFGTSSRFAPVSSSAFNTASSYSSSAYASSITTSLLNLQSKAFEIQRLGGVVPSSVTNVLSSYSYGGSSLGAASQQGYTRAQVASMTSGGTKYVIAPETRSSSYDWSSDRYANMIKSSTNYFFGRGGVVDSVSRTSAVISSIYRWR